MAIVRTYMGQLSQVKRSQTISSMLKAHLIDALVWPVVKYIVTKLDIEQQVRHNTEMQ